MLEVNQTRGWALHRHSTNFSPLFRTAFVCSLTFVIGANAETEPRSVHISAAELLESVAHTTNGVAGYELPTGPGAKVIQGRRDISGEPEIHLTENDFWVVQAGNGKVRVGGHLNGAHEISPHELRGGEFVGGIVFDVRSGDVLWIPAGIPHQTLVEEIPFRYLIIKTPSSGSK